MPKANSRSNAQIIQLREQARQLSDEVLARLRNSGTLVRHLKALINAEPIGRGDPFTRW